MHKITPFEDGYLHKGLRKKLVDSLREKGISDERVLGALMDVPRHFFMERAFGNRAYEDVAFPISAGQTISQPYTVALQTQLLEVRKFDKVLEVGTGSGYQSCVLSALGAFVYSIERQRELYDRLLGKRDRKPGEEERPSVLARYPSVKTFFGDGYDGLPTFGPFDRCIVTAGAPAIPPKLIAQLKPGGIMVIPVGNDSSQKMLRLRKEADGTMTEETFGEASFVPMLEGMTKK